MSAPRNTALPTVDVFLSYAHKDEQLCDHFREHLSALRRAKIVNDWHDRKIDAGGNWEGRIDEQLERAHLVLFLVSSSFLSSDYCQDIEVHRAMERHRAGDAVVVPIVLRDCEWRDALFGHLNPLPRRHRAVTLAPDRDEALAEITRELKGIIERRWADATTQPPDCAAIPLTKIAGQHQTLSAHFGDLFIVIRKDVKTGPVFNVDMTLTNSGSTVATIQRLDTQLIDPHESSFRMRWKLFYRYVRPGVMDKESDPHPLTLPARGRRDVGIQFLAPASVRDYDWPIGRYEFDVLGWTGSSLDSAQPDFARRHEITVDSRASDEVRWAATAPEEWWIERNDPHNAVGVRVGVQSHSGS
ncbi:MAG: toll/interleukin-1 receptor domain-containing protein [Burkholderiales bacterium]|nr:toll/interleukin-1 receptor domain-containing protein [Burkholderiales bacterium]